eukprot:TRINITY_DN1892_c0_g1_i1.p1 TRINITY_DN1892_c0_g1~~TRINITY_DN1892_c0_g1_i1.p1  ORF type:complete len:299 (+),score=42.05 TRINITY_DN1892_c0_g1_i1:823-1719(+)
MKKNSQVQMSSLEKRNEEKLMVALKCHADGLKEEVSTKVQNMVAVAVAVGSPENESKLKERMDTLEEQFKEQAQQIAVTQNTVTELTRKVSCLRTTTPVEICRLKEILRFEPGYKPLLHCDQELAKHEAVLGLFDVETLIENVNYTITQLDPLPISIKNTGLDYDEKFAIIAYTHDFGDVSKREKNLYFIFNQDLRCRASDKMEAWKGYRYFLHHGLSKLPPVVGKVYRGVEASKRAQVESHYTPGRIIRWTGYTSTSMRLEPSKVFAGPGGVVFRVNIKTGRKISCLSVIPTEDEVL